MEMNGEKSADFEAVRARLFALAYRMLGSRAEAEDIVQDAWLKWHAADASELRSSAAWLTTITTHLAIDRLRHLQIERTTRSGGWMPEPWIESLAPSAEDLALQAVQMSYGVMLLLERLKPEERAAIAITRRSRRFLRRRPRIAGRWCIARGRVCSAKACRRSGRTRPRMRASSSACGRQWKRRIARASCGSSARCRA
jgi:DNA-directed RNA polymerase specialized sigma24 family protein